MASPGAVHRRPSTHHVSIGRQVTQAFDPARPNLLMYDSDSDSGRLTGMVWAVVSGEMPPEGFPGDNDHWHFHERLCFVDGPRRAVHRR